MHQFQLANSKSVDTRLVLHGWLFTAIAFFIFCASPFCADLYGQDRDGSRMSELEILDIFRDLGTLVAESVANTDAEETAYIYAPGNDSVVGSQVTRSGVERRRYFRHNGVIGAKRTQLSHDSSILIWNVVDNLPASDHVDAIPVTRRLLVASRRNGVLSGNIYDAARFPDEILTLLRALPRHSKLSAIVPKIEPASIRVIDERLPVKVASAFPLSGFVCASGNRLLYAECPVNQSLRYLEKWVAPAGNSIVDCSVSREGNSIVFLTDGPSPNLYSLPAAGWDSQLPKRFESGGDSGCVLTANSAVVATWNRYRRSGFPAFRCIDAIPQQLQSRFQQFPESLYRFSSDGRLALLHETSGEVILHDADTPENPKTLMANVARIATAEFSPDNKRLVLSCVTVPDGCKTMIFEIDSTVPPKSLYLFNVFEAELVNAIWIRDSSKLLAQHRATGLFSVNTTGGIHVWDVASAKHLHTFTGEPFQLMDSSEGYGMAIIDNGQTLVAGSRHGSVYLWKLLPESDSAN